MRNCPNCAAPVTGPYCDYCGTPTYTPTDAVGGARGKRVHCWYEDGGVKHCFDMFVGSISTETEYTTLRTDFGPCASVPGRTTLGIEAEMLDLDRDAWHGLLMRWDDSLRFEEAG